LRWHSEASTGSNLSLLIAGEGGVHTNDAGVSYMVNGRQSIAIAVSTVSGAELLVYALPQQP
jgi:hypothetical protein